MIFPFHPVEIIKAESHYDRGFTSREVNAIGRTVNERIFCLGFGAISLVMIFPFHPIEIIKA